MGKIAETFRTTTVTALEAELGLLLVNIQLRYEPQLYVACLLTIPDGHPILRLCLDTFFKTLNNIWEDKTLLNMTA
jgi:hypothetical protein